MTLPLKHLCSSLLDSMLGPLERQATCAISRALSKGKAAGGAADPYYTVPSSRESLYSRWAASRTVPDGRGTLLTPGGQRLLSRTNISLAIGISQDSMPKILSLLWQLHPTRIFIMVALDIFRGVLPACRGYSQALIINELQAIISSGNFTFARLCRLITTDLFRMALESLIDSLANANADVVQNSARFLMEYRQMEQRLKMDVPTLADPQIRDLFQESELFVRSFSGVSSFGLLSPLDFLRVLTLISELFSHAWMLWSLTFGTTHIWLLLFSVISAILPLILSYWTPNASYLDDIHDATSARATAKQNRMHAMAYSDVDRPEIVLFGLGPWILQTWAKARRITLGIEKHNRASTDSFAASLLSQVNVTGILAAIQNIPTLMALQSSSTSLGSLSLYRTSVQSLVFTSRQLLQTLRMSFQGIFLMGAFCAAMEVQPQLQPERKRVVKYKSSGRGMRIEARHLSYTYPGSYKPALRDVNLVLEAGESLAIVGYNGSGKSTLAKVLLRVLEYGGGELVVNGHDLRQLDPTDYHTRVTTVLQGFSKFESSLKENVGVGYLPEMRSGDAVKKAVDLAGARNILCALPKGMKTILDTSSGPSSPVREEFFPRGCPGHQRHGLSGGEWQRIAISRAFMRAHRPEVELVVLDEPTSSLDAHAQNHVFDTVEELSRSPSGCKTKTVIFITHRLSTARRADKIAMMENGTITEFGTHKELLDRGGSYAALYQAST